VKVERDSHQSVLLSANSGQALDIRQHEIDWTPRPGRDLGSDQRASRQVYRRAMSHRPTIARAARIIALKLDHGSIRRAIARKA
jgi:hypothetical protein